MFWSFLFSLSLFGICLFVYLYWRTKQQTMRLQNKSFDQIEQIKILNVEKENLATELHSLQSKLHSAIEDPVTHLLGWQLFEDRLKQNINESARYQFTMGVLYIDIDHFKMINEGLGYEVGDSLLLEMAKRLQSCIRQVDNITRLAKDIFVATLTQLSKPETAAVVAERMLQAVKEPFQIDGHELTITICIGISIYPLDGTESASLLRNADQALRLAKNKGKNVYQFYKENINVNSQRELMISLSLKHESVYQQFALYYEPIFDVKNEILFGMDTILHWEHPRIGLVSLEELFYHAEKQHQLNQITEWMLKNACKKFLEWHSVGFAPRYLGMPIQIKQLESSQFIYRISQILQELKFNPEWLIFEIKESPLQQSFDVLEKGFNMLNYLGIKLAIDDFGNGPFSFSYIKNINLHYLKIDRSFTNEMDQNAKAYNIVKSFIYLAQALSIQVIVKGVESEVQLQKLKQLNCELMQGQFFSPPLPEQEVTKKLVTLP